MLQEEIRPPQNHHQHHQHNQPNQQNQPFNFGNLPQNIPQNLNMNNQFNLNLNPNINNPSEPITLTKEQVELLVKTMELHQQQLAVINQQINNIRMVLLGHGVQQQNQPQQPPQPQQQQQTQAEILDDESELINRALAMLRMNIKNDFQNVKLPLLLEKKKCHHLLLQNPQKKEDFDSNSNPNSPSTNSDDPNEIRKKRLLRFSAQQ